MSGVAETVGRAFNSKKGTNQQVIHVLPERSKAWEYGQTYFAGANMEERRGNPSLCK
jgi:hypothetical protein